MSQTVHVAAGIHTRHECYFCGAPIWIESSGYTYACVDPGSPEWEVVWKKARAERTETVHHGDDSRVFTGTQYDQGDNYAWYDELHGAA